MRPKTLATRFADLLAARGPLLAVIAGVVLTLPSLASGLAFDDVMHRAKARGAFGDSLAARLDLFTFVPGDHAKDGWLLDSGFVPWFAAPDLRLAFFRPLSALLAFFDYNVLDRTPWIMHAESLALYALVVAVVGLLYRRFLPPAVAGLAALLYAIDDGHGMPVGWLADRNAILATVLGAAALLAHDRWRRDGWAIGAFAGPLAFAAALLSGELALGVLGYLAAYAVTVDPGARRARALSLAPYVVVAVAWQIVYRALGYGARASGVYLDPTTAPGAFLRALPGHFAALVLGELALPPADLYPFVPRAGQAAIALVAVALVVWVARALGPKLRVDAATRFLALGALLAVFPSTASFPADRLLPIVGIGGSAIVAQVIGGLASIAPSPLGARILRGVFVAVHLVLSPLALPVTSAESRLVADSFGRAAAHVRAPPELAKQTLVLVNSPAVLIAFNWMFPASAERTAPRRIRGLSSSLGPVQILREDARTLLVTTDPRAASDPILVIFRDGSHPVHEGETFEVPGLRAEIVRIDPESGPVALRYTFDVDLDDPSLRWVAWDGVTDVDYTPPRIGGANVVGPRSDPPP